MTGVTAGRWAHAPSACEPLRQVADLRFRALLGAEAWASLEPAIQVRFSKRLFPGTSVSYSGVVDCEMTWAGWLLAQCCRLIGAPLPLERYKGVAAVVTITEDGKSGGQVWTRMYAGRRGFPQVIHSAKRFAGPTGLEEYLGGGVGIAETVEAHPSRLSFHSDHYFLAVGRRRFRLPRWLGPGHLRIDHVDRGGGCFDFILMLRHPLFGLLIHQVGRFRDPADVKGGKDR